MSALALEGFSHVALPTTQLLPLTEVKHCSFPTNSSPQSCGVCGGCCDDPGPWQPQGTGQPPPQDPGQYHGTGHAQRAPRCHSNLWGAARGCVCTQDPFVLSSLGGCRGPV